MIKKKKSPKNQNSDVLFQGHSLKHSSTAVLRLPGLRGDILLQDAVVNN